MSSINTKRKRLFRGGRPFVRPFNAEQDMWVLWAAYDLKSFPLMKEGMSREEFEAHVAAIMKAHSAVLVIEDECRYFKAGKGPIALVTIDNFGWRIEPFCDFFRWASPRMKLRAVVSFFQMVRSNKEVKFCFWHALSKFEKFYERMRDYGIPVGKVPVCEGELMFYMRGKTAGRISNPGTA